MKQRRIAYITLLVKNYDEAIDFYTQKLGFILMQDVKLSTTKRWVIIAPKNETGSALLLALAHGDLQIDTIGNQAGDRVFLFLHTDDFSRDYTEMRKKGVIFTESPRNEPYGKVVVFKDLYGNLWDLIEPK
ncbi:VOC family protein [uncultured Kriegella sp.]|uniref:VOC family protein n=1 Tax=uncultured Kriegella sp. TaxID=1798910 RepID=UPI0030DCD7ED|tara:strand:- start:149342 stop:149734 length:393 start_codon:yes stop_codon:yes gene_type:complete